MPLRSDEIAEGEAIVKRIVGEEVAKLRSKATPPKVEIEKVEIPEKKVETKKKY